MINFGPAVRFQGKRDEDDVGAPVGNVGFTVEVGGFVDINPSRNFRIRAELRRGLGGHKAWVGSLGADLILRDDQNYIFSVGPRVRWGDNRYNDTYFGLPFSIPAVGLPAAYNPGGGVTAIGGIANFTHRLGRNWGLQAYAGYDRLVRDAADSPIVRAFGSAANSPAAAACGQFNVGGGGADARLNGTDNYWSATRLNGAAPAGDKYILSPFLAVRRLDIPFAGLGPRKQLRVLRAPRLQFLLGPGIGRNLVERIGKLSLLRLRGAGIGHLVSPRPSKRAAL